MNHLAEGEVGPVNRFKPPPPPLILFYWPFQDGTSVFLVLVSVSVLFSTSIRLEVRLLSCHLWGMSCSFGLPYVLFVSCLFVILVVSYYGFEGGTVVLIASAPGYCLPFTF